MQRILLCTTRLGRLFPNNHLPPWPSSAGIALLKWAIFVAKLSKCRLIYTQYRRLMHWWRVGTIGHETCRSRFHNPISLRAVCIYGGRSHARLVIGTTRALRIIPRHHHPIRQAEQGPGHGSSRSNFSQFQRPALCFGLTVSMPFRRAFNRSLQTTVKEIRI
jgi:hypothetical protein